MVRKWEAAPETLHKVNFDGALYSHSRKGDVGVLLRDHRGQVAGAVAFIVNLVSDACVIEAIAAVKALEFATQMGCRKIVLEGDSRIVSNCLTKKDEVLSNIGPIIHDGRRWVRKFDICMIEHTKREGNVAAHSLAQYSLQLNSDRFWVEDFPDSITLAVLMDIASLNK
ncbi:uncharacterized protein LOC111289202 [Durio zibethinus]|uniref:Uncharacterized protein LOC111289202 n=1 Tax=Durio zibethinus TaxID=66656 RepID=A0A6P5Y5S1_DURZI|nr:uncharacterized protein LOC111289202 [Durio zibethinus]